MYVTLNTRAKNEEKRSQFLMYKQVNQPQCYIKLMSQFFLFTFKGLSELLSTLFETGQIDKVKYKIYEMAFRYFF
jgi:hypothetical protein